MKRPFITSLTYTCLLYTSNPLGTDEKGEPVWYVKDTYRQFLNAAKEALGDKYLSFNPVGGQGIEQANTSRADVLYTEFWPWDQDREGIAYNTYSALAGEIERTMEESKMCIRDRLEALFCAGQ